uniref:ubiquitinyl hydrolase 1 n=1 Tax=Petromyzon marinus TaxID=7757 RepID=A0AAJ7WWJ8_PETMA|nr:putative bifunctional UDP-N-acetylglucosamine transferase and deubiquitinase ALG13 isoform X1 [Petromyzon marinus]
MNEAQGSRYRSRECEQMDAGLAVLGLHRVAVARDSSSVYRVVAQEIFYTQSKHREVRRECAQFIQGNSDSLKKISKSPLKCIVNSVLDPRMPAGNVEMAALALLYRCDFLIYREPNKPPFKATSNGFSKKVMLCQRYEAKYDAVCSKQTYTAAAICQSIVYNLLYTHVFGVSPDVVAREVEWFRLQEETQGRQKESRHPTTLARDGKPLVGYSYAEKTSRKIIKAGQAHFPVFPFRVLKSLDSEIYRNVEFDVWIDSARGYTMTRFPVLEFSGGEKCEVQLKPGGRYYSASIQKINPNYQTVTVFIKALAQRHHVMLESVRAMGYQSASERMMGIQGASSRQLFEMPIQHRKHERYYGHLSHSYRQDYPSYSGRLTGSGSLYKGHSNGQHCKPPRKMERPPAHGSEERLGGVKSTGTAVQVELSSTSDVQEPNSGLTDFTGKYDSPGADQSEQTENGSNDLILDTHCVDKSEEGTEDPNVTPLNNPVVDGENAYVEKSEQSIPANASTLPSSVQQPIAPIYSQLAYPKAVPSCVYLFPPWKAECVNELGEVMSSSPPFSFDPSASDLPQDKKILQYFFNRGLQSWWHERAYAQNCLESGSGHEASLYQEALKPHLDTATSPNPPTLQLQTQPLGAQTAAPYHHAYTSINPGGPQPIFVQPMPQHQLPYSHAPTMAHHTPWQRGLLQWKPRML